MSSGPAVRKASPPQPQPPEVDVTQFWTISGDSPKALRITQDDEKEFVAPYMRFVSAQRIGREIQIAFGVCVIKIIVDKKIPVDGLLQGLHEFSVSEIRNRKDQGFQLATFVVVGKEFVPF